MGEQLRPNRRATLAPATLDRSSRTVDAVLATDAIVARAGMAERLTITAEAVDLSRAPLPVLDGHRAQSADDILGVLEDIRIEAGRLLGTLRIAPGQRGDGVLDKIEASILQSVSIGYVVNSFRDARGDDGRTVRTVTRFTLYEASLVALPVDPAARIRAVNEEDNMNDQIEAAPAVAPEADAIAARAAVNVEIRGLAETAGLDREWADQQIDAHASLVEARAAAFEAMKARGGAPIQTARATIGDGQEDAERVIHGMAEALSCRANPALEPSAAAKPYLNRRLLDLARDRLEARGISTRGLSDAEVTHRSMTTSDLPLILGTTVNRELRRMYEAQPDGLRQVASQRTAPDFREARRIQLSGAPQPILKAEAAEYQRGALADASENVRLKTYGVMLSMTREMVINDDLGALTQVPAAAAVASRNFENAQLAAKLEENPVMSDGAAAFDASHGNLAAAGEALSEATLSAGRLAMRKQTGIGDAVVAAQRINVTPRFLVVPPELETIAEKLLTTVQARKTEDVNPFATLTLVVDNHLGDPTAWYLAADPAQVDGLEYAYLAGAPGPQVETRTDFATDNVEIKLRLDFGCAFIDWRSWYKNAGT